MENEAKKGVVAMHRFKGSYDGFDIEVVVRDKGSKQFLYEIKFIEKEKSPQQSMTDESASPAPLGDAENKPIITHSEKKSNTHSENSSENFSGGSNTGRSELAGISIGRGNGYHGYSMSNNAKEAYENGEMPLSKWTKTAIIDAIANIRTPNTSTAIMGVFIRYWLLHLSWIRVILRPCWAKTEISEFTRKRRKAFRKEVRATECRRI